jgi:DNA processing protein
MDDEIEALVRLNLTPGLGPARILSLLKRAGSAEAALRAPPSVWEDAKVPGPVAEWATSPNAARLARSEVEEASRRGVSLLSIRSAGYPAALEKIPLPPPLLYVRGDAGSLGDPALAIVGSRDATGYGRSMARRLAAGVAAAGYTIVSGLARGIDSEAHRAALDADGRTVAVLASGLGRISSSEDPSLPDRIVGSGAMISEFPLSSPAHKVHFPRRNRLISGLARGVLVVEAAEKSGSLLTAQWALDQNRLVLAVPGRADNPMAVGVNRLLGRGAAVILDVSDVLAEISQSAQGPPLPRCDGSEALLASIGAEGGTLDEIAVAAGRPPEDLLEDLLRLELAGRIRRAPGGLYRPLAGGR